MSIGKRIANVRKERNISQEELAGRIYVSRQSISKWESDQVIPDTENVIALAKALNVSVEWIISGSKQISKKNFQKDFIVLIIGSVFFVTSIILVIAYPQMLSETSSVITFNEFSILIVISVAITIWGIILAYKRKK
ncbi:MAG TPA: helix-turn-helix transcriptional regulator [Bacilli bacterium]|nr:helix-turn-helix transcriptional regulator [Bacilli bacterium]